MTLKHYDHDGRARFITLSTYRRIPILANDHFRRILAESIDHVRQESSCRLFGYVIMPEHVHMVLLPDEKTTIGPLVGEVKRISSKRIHESLTRQDVDLVRTLTVVRDGVPRFAFWQRRCFDHNCRSEESLWEKITYCHHNPVKRGLVSKPEDWIWSSFRWYQGKQEVPLKMDFSLDDSSEARSSNAPVGCGTGLLAWRAKSGR